MKIDHIFNRLQELHVQRRINWFWSAWHNVWRLNEVHSVDPSNSITEYSIKKPQKKVIQSPSLQSFRLIRPILIDKFNLYFLRPDGHFSLYWFIEIFSFSVNPIFHKNFSSGIKKTCNKNSRPKYSINNLKHFNGP